MHRSTTTAPAAPPFCLSLIAAHVFPRVTRETKTSYRCRCDIVSPTYARCTRNETRRTAPCTVGALCYLSRSHTASESRPPPPCDLKARSRVRESRRFPSGRPGRRESRAHHERTVLFVGKGQADAPLFRRGLRMRVHGGAICQRALALRACR